jgi:hypothetical protein
MSLESRDAACRFLLQQPKAPFPSLIPDKAISRGRHLHYFKCKSQLYNGLQLLRESNDVCFWLLYVYHPHYLGRALEGTEMSRRRADRFNGSVRPLRQAYSKPPILKRKQTAGVR